MSDHKRLLYRGQYINLVASSGWEYAERRHRAVVLIAWTPDGELLLVEQFRIPLNSRTIELPAGLVGDSPGQEGESLATAAGRELEEETGWRAENWQELMTCPTSAGLTDEVVTFMLAGNLEPVGAGGGDASEDIVVHRIAGGDINRWLRQRHDQGIAVDPKVYTALYWSQGKK